MFGWASNGDIYFGDGGNLLRMSADGSNKATLLSDSLRTGYSAKRLSRRALYRVRVGQSCRQ